MPERRVLDLFQIKKRFLRSAHLERDFHDESALDGYIITDDIKTGIDRIASGLSISSSQRAWRITGNYGSGKSSFALVLANLLSGKRKNLSSAIQKAINFNKLGIPVPSLIPILVTGSREPLSTALLQALLLALKNVYVYNKESEIIKRIEVLLKRISSSTEYSNNNDDAVIELIKAANSFIKTTRKGTGLLIILDELGKFLEYAAIHPERQDVYFLQKLGETAARSGKLPLFVVGLLHQGFNAYADQLTPSAQREWEKVAGRFEELIFNQPIEQMTILIGNSLNIRTRLLPKSIIDNMKNEMGSILELGWYGAAFNKNRLIDIASGVYPLHPSVIPVLMNLFRRFGQNERSLFSFTLSNEPFALQEFAAQKIEGNSLYRLYHLYDYARSAFGHRLSAQSYRNRWNYIDSLIESFHSSDETELKILKTVGILNLLDSPQFLPTEASIAAAISEQKVLHPRTVKSALMKLQNEKRVLYNRGAAGGYCLWPYTSINLERVYEDATKELSGRPSISLVIKEYVETRPIVARRHYIETGNLRHFEVRYIQVSELDHDLMRRESSADGLIFVPLYENEEEHNRAMRFVKSGALKDKPHIFFALPKTLGDLTGLVQEALRWQWIGGNTRELNTDTYAAEEVSRQIAASRKILEKRILSFVGIKQFTEKMELQWFCLGKKVDVSNSRALLSLLSDVCDKLYHKAPEVKNELVNRNTISSAAASARMRLIERLFQHSSKPFLGMDPLKKPPEMSIYLSLFKKAGLHRQNDNDFIISEPLPEDDNCNMLPSFDKIREVLQNDPERRVRLDDIYKELKKEPYGVRDGIIPIILAVFVKANEQNIAFYQNGSFIRSIDGVLFQRIIKAPEAYEIQYCRITDSRADLFEKMIEVLGFERTTKHRIELLDVVMPLCSFVASLPPYTHNTKKLTPLAFEIRDRIIDAHEPARLIFTDLPAACGIGVFALDEHKEESNIRLAKVIKSAIDELKAAYPELLCRLRERLHEVFGVPRQLLQYRSHITERTLKIMSMVTEPTLKSFCLRLTDEKLEEMAWLESIGSFVARTPPSRWHDREEEVFHQELNQLMMRFSRVESIVFKSCEQSNFRDDIRLSITKANGYEQERVIHINSADEKKLTEIQTVFERVLNIDNRLSVAAAARALWDILQREIESQGKD